MSKSKNGNGHAGSGVFGSPDRVLVKRGLAEFRSGRPVIFSSADKKYLLALPVDGLDEARLHAFEQLCAPTVPQLVVTARRARALGIESAGAVALDLEDGVSSDEIYSLVADADPEEDADLAGAADERAAAAIELAKIAHRLPALLIAEIASPSSVLIEPPLVVVASEAVKKFRKDDVHALEIASEAKVPLQGGHRRLASSFSVMRSAVARWR